jgi:DNA-binding MarR family transcriptional regulator
MPQDEVRYRNPVKEVGFAMVYHMMTLDDRIGDGAFRLYCRYLFYSQQKSKCWPGRDTLAKVLGVGVATISRWNKELETAGYITRQRRLGTSSITWIEDVESIETISNAAIAELDSRECIIDDTTVVSPVIPRSSQECDREEESEKENKEKQLVADALVDWESAEAWDKTNPMTVFIYPEDMTFNCPNPFCDMEVAWASLRKSKAVCPHCGQYISGIEYGGKVPVYKPPKAIRKKQILGNLLPNISEAYAYLPYFANDAAKLKKMLDKEPDLLYNCLQWSVGKVADSSMPERKAVGAALSLVEKKLRARAATNTTTTVETAIKGTDYTLEEMERIRRWASKLTD